ncbi:hypothetical protein Aduo_006584 [Ancylostoma duodenale]
MSSFPMECLTKVIVIVLLLSYHCSDAKAIRRATSQGSSPFVSLLSGISREAGRNDRSEMDRTRDYEDYESADDSTDSGINALMEILKLSSTPGVIKALCFMNNLLNRGFSRGFMRAKPDYSDYNYGYYQDQMDQYDYRSDVDGTEDDPDDFDDEGEGKGSEAVGRLFNKLRQKFRGNPRYKKDADKASNDTDGGRVVGQLERDGNREDDLSGVPMCSTSHKVFLSGKEKEGCAGAVAFANVVCGDYLQCTLSKKRPGSDCRAKICEKFNATPKKDCFKNLFTCD